MCRAPVDRSLPALRRRRRDGGRKRHSCVPSDRDAHRNCECVLVPVVSIEHEEAGVFARANARRADDGRPGLCPAARLQAQSSVQPSARSIGIAHDQVPAAGGLAGNVEEGGCDGVPGHRDRRGGDVLLTLAGKFDRRSCLEAASAHQQPDRRPVADRRGLDTEDLKATEDPPPPRCRSPCRAAGGSRA